MTPYQDITKTKEFKFLMVLLLIGILLFGLLFFRNVFGALPFSDNFEAYETGDLAGQGGWTHLDSTGTYEVIDTFRHTGTKAVQEFSGRIDKLGEYVSIGEWAFWYYKTSTGLNTEILLLGDWEVWDIGCGDVFIDNGEGIAKIYDMAGEFPLVTFDSTPYNEWFQLTIQWDFITMLYRARINQNEWSDWVNIYNTCTDLGFRGLRLRTGSSGGELFLDDIGEAGLPAMRIFGISPESGIEVADLNLEITIGYEGFDWEEYDGFTIAFWDERLHASSKVKIYVEEDLEEDGSGEVVVNLTDFGLDKKGRWYLTGLGFGTHLDIQSGMFLTTLGYVDFWTGELVSPDYYFIVVAEELPDLYPISDFEIWYGEHVVEWETPTDFALAIASFFQPILEKTGEFNERTQIYLDTNEAYIRGKSLGDIFPIISGWVANISYFMGGFPLVSWFKYILIILLAIFIIRGVFKFIPFFG